MQRSQRVLVKESIQEQLYQRTFQNPREIGDGFSIIGVKKLWTICAKNMECRAEDVKKHLDKIASRRNKIVHEGDLVRHKKGGRPRQAKITPKQVADDIEWLGILVDAFENAIQTA